MKKIAILASGNGTNAENIIRYFQHPSHKGKAEVALVISNRREAKVLDRADALGVPTLYLPKAELNNPDVILPLLADKGIDLVVLAGYLLMVPEFLIDAYPKGIINIHPSLLPKFGGKGMYGHHVDEAVVAAGEKETGITIHYVSAGCDEGEIIFQASFPLLPGDTPETVEGRIHQLEMRHFPEVIDSLLG